MKKISIFIILLIISSFLFMNKADASVFELENRIEWEIVTVNDIDLFRTKRTDIDFTSLAIEMWADLYTVDFPNPIENYIQLECNGTTSAVNVYETRTSVNPLDTYNFVESDIHAEDLLLLNDTQATAVDLSTYQNKYVEISMVLKPGLSQTQKNTILEFSKTNKSETISLFPEYSLTNYTYTPKYEPTVKDDSWWHVIDGNKAYIHMSPKYKKTQTNEELAQAQNSLADEHHFNQWWNNIAFTFISNEWPQGQGITKPGEDWNRLVIEVKYRNQIKDIVYNGIVDHGFIFMTSPLVYSPNGLNYNYSWSIHTTEFVNGRIDTVDNILNSSFSNTIQNSDIVSIKMYFERSNNPIAISSPLELPITTGSAFSYEQMEDIGLAYFEVNGNNATVSIDYNNQTYVLNYTNFDTGFLEDIKKAYYFTHNGNRIIHLIYDEHIAAYDETNPNILANQMWSPYVHWNLTTDEIITTEKVSVLTYFKLESSNNIFAYFYMPDIISDKLIHIDMTFDYRYYKAGFPDFWNEYPMNIEKGSVSLDYDESNLTTPQWKKDLYKYTPIAMAIGTMIPGIRWPVLIIGSSLLASNYISTETGFLQKDISEIDTITPDTPLKDEIEASYTRMSGRPTQIDENTNNLYKLHIGQYDDKSKVEVMEDSENITNIIYEINGKRILIEEDYILDQFDRDDNLGEGDLPTLLPDLGDGPLKYIVIIIIVIILLNVLPKLDTVLNSVFKVISNPKKLVSLIFVIIILLLIFKII